MATLLCINPKSRLGASVDCESLVGRLERLGPVVLHRLGDGNLEQALAEIGGSLERIVVGGGDGTLNSVLTTVIDAGVPLGVLPLGTGNDFARGLGLPLDPDAALDVILAGSTRRVGVGQANGRWFLNAAGLGLGPELTRKLDREKKKRLGVLAYLSSLLEVIGNWRTRRALVRGDNWKRRTPFMQITVANGIHYGGGLTIADDARLDDGRLHVLVLKPQTPFELVRKFFALKFGVRRGEEPDKMELLSSEQVVVETRRPCDVTVDGELVGRTPLECRCVPGVIEVYSPAESA